MFAVGAQRGSRDIGVLLLLFAIHHDQVPVVSVTGLVGVVLAVRTKHDISGAVEVGPGLAINHGKRLIAGLGGESVMLAVGAKSDRGSQLAW